MIISKFSHYKESCNQKNLSMYILSLLYDQFLSQEHENIIAKLPLSNAVPM